MNRAKKVRPAEIKSRLAALKAPSSRNQSFCSGCLQLVCSALVAAAADHSALARGQF